MKKWISVLLVACMLVGMICITGCSNTDTAAIYEELSEEKYEWERIFTSETSDNEVLTISRRHGSGYVIFHGSYFKVTIYKDDVCTYYYASDMVSCQRGLLPCKGDLATFVDACEVDANLAAILPYVETVIANIIMENMIHGNYDAAQMSEILFKKMITDWFTEYQDSLISELNTSAIGMAIDANDYISKVMEIAFGVQDAVDNTEATSGLTTEEYARLIMPWLSEIETGFTLIKIRFAYEHTKALALLDSLTGTYDSGNLTMANYEVKFDEVIQDLHQSFKDVMDDIDAQKAAEEAKKAEKWENFWEDFFSFGAIEL